MIGNLLQKCVDIAIERLNFQYYKPSDPESKITIDDLDVHLWRQEIYDPKPRTVWVAVVVYPRFDEPKNAFVFSDGDLVWSADPGPIFHSLLDNRQMPIGAEKEVWDTLGLWW